MSSGVALVTGAGHGIGKAAAIALARAGFAVGLVARSAARLEETAAVVERDGVPVVAWAADVRDFSSLQRAIGAVEERLGPITTLINNAGTQLAIGPLWEIDPDEWRSDVDTSLLGTFNACRIVVPGMIGRGAGRILNVSSYAAARAAPYETGYACGKAAVTNLSESLAASLAPHGVRVFAVTPGFVDTQLTRRLRESAAGRRWLPEAQGREPLDIDLFTTLVVSLALGHADALSGRFLHALDDLDILLARLDEIDREGLYALRLRRLPGR